MTFFKSHKSISYSHKSYKSYNSHKSYKSLFTLFPFFYTPHPVYTPPQEYNQAPVAKDDKAYGYKNTALVISTTELLMNDTDPNGDAIKAVGVSNAVNGTVVWDGTNVIFTPTAGYAGPASFTYTIADSKGLQSSATVNLTIAYNPHQENTIYGSDAADHLVGTSGNDVIYGLAGDDVIKGGDGNDTIIGGAGNDLMVGGAGADTFVWTLADTAGHGIEVDTIHADAHDKLNLKDLLVGEANNAHSLDKYLNFSFENGNTVISVSSHGTFGENSQYNPYNQAGSGTVDQKIVLSGFDLTAGNTLSDVQMIQTLLNGQHLITD